MKVLPPIPTPLRQRLKPIRQKWVPIIVLLVVMVAIALVWRRIARPTSFVGVVETVQTVVTTPDAGVLTNISINPLQDVVAGDVVAEVLTTDPRTVNSRLSVLRGRMQLMEMELDPVLNRQRNALDYERLMVDCAKIKDDLVTAKALLEGARSKFKFESDLMAEGISSKETYADALMQKNALEVSVAEKEKIVALTEKSLERLAYMADSFVPGGENDPLKAALGVEEDKMKLFQAKLRPLELQAPIDGIVTLLHKRPGEQVLPGDPIVTVTARKPERILGYLPQAFPINPTVGMKVEVATRSPLSFWRIKSIATITGVSPNLEPITNLLMRPIIPGLSMDQQLPVLGRVISISLPVDLNLLPGQPLDITLLPTAEPVELLSTKAVNPQVPK
ncbi:MAG TPA: HlyD family efflux transporter periplasmic adaptor subunit [Verrucomicrobiae bacterium]|nr:HlyD family efflux transporter periplasmic adaptor subunit [Verrucomicrobiae bacterium]